MMVVLQDLIETSLYKYLNVAIHHQWASLFALHMNSKFQIFTYNNASVAGQWVTVHKTLWPYELKSYSAA